LHQAASAGKEVATNGVKLAELLISNGGDMSGKNADGNSPLHNAVRVDKAIVEFLIAHGADASIQDNKGRTALNLAEQTRGRAEIAELLSKHSDKK
jgi:ankyrin repeat protein